MPIVRQMPSTELVRSAASVRSCRTFSTLTPRRPPSALPGQVRLVELESAAPAAPPRPTTAPRSHRALAGSVIATNVRQHSDGEAGSLHRV